MTRRWAAMVDRATLLLDARDRDAVRGDLEELGVGGPRALCEILGLVVRRQVQSWSEWRPWVGLIGVGLPLGVVLGATARWWTDHTAIYTWLYVDNWTSGYLDSAGSRAELARTIAGIFTGALALAFTSWASAFVVTTLSVRTLPVSSVLFCLALAAGFASAPARDAQHAAVFVFAFYSVVLPLLAATLLVAVPAFCGVRTARKHQEVS